MDFINLSIGILLFILGFILFTLDMKEFMTIKKEEYIRKSFYPKIFLGTIVSMVVGIIMIYQELKTLL